VRRDNPSSEDTLISALENSLESLSSELVGDFWKNLSKQRSSKFSPVGDKSYE